MTWAIHRVSLPTHDLAAARTFFGAFLGLGEASEIDPHTIAFGHAGRGLRLRKPPAAISTAGGEVLAPAARHVAIEVADLPSLATRLTQAGIAHVAAQAGDFTVPALYTIDPAQNVVAFCQAAAPPSAEDVQPWEAAWGWGVHHVNLPAGDVRAAAAFYTERGGLAEGIWQAPASRGKFSIDRTELAVMPLGARNRGLHVIRPDAGFAHRNNFVHNPSIGGHPAFFVPDVMAVKARLEAAGFAVTDAGVYAMVGMHQIYVLDPSANMIEVNQFV